MYVKENSLPKITYIGTSQSFSQIVWTFSSPESVKKRFMYECVCVCAYVSMCLYILRENNFKCWLPYTFVCCCFFFFTFFQTPYGNTGTDDGDDIKLNNKKKTKYGTLSQFLIFPEKKNRHYDFHFFFLLSYNLHKMFNNNVRFCIFD